MDPRLNDKPFVTRRDFLKLAGASLGAAALPAWSAGPAAASARAGNAKKLNVLLLISDDCRAALGCYGAPTVTPHIDRLARRGLRFEQAYCQYPLCNPSRASFMTGLRPDTTGVDDNVTNFRRHLPNTVTMPQLFKNNGYYVARVGKIYHYGVPARIGTNGMDDPGSWEQVVNPKGRDVADEDKIYSIIAAKKEGERAGVAVGTHEYGGNLSWLPAEGEDIEQTDGKIAAEACSLLREHKDEPFFLGVGFFRPHTPYVSPKKYFDLYPRETLTLAHDPANDRATKPRTPFWIEPANYGMDEQQQRTVMQAYYASVSFMDAQFGIVLQELERLGLAENTVVVFISDHGYHLGEHGQWQKKSLFEECARVPMIVATPGMKTAGQTTARLAELVDLYPTLADLCGLETPKSLEGVSLKPLLDDPRRPWKKAAFTQLDSGAMILFAPGKGKGLVNPVQDKDAARGYSVRTERYRYIEWGPDGKAGRELYDQQADPHEWRNLAGDPQSARILRQMEALLHGGWQAARP